MRMQASWVDKGAVRSPYRSAVEGMGLARDYPDSVMRTGTTTPAFDTTGVGMHEAAALLALFSRPIARRRKLVVCTRKRRARPSRHAEVRHAVRISRSLRLRCARNRRPRGAQVATLPLPSTAFGGRPARQGRSVSLLAWDWLGRVSSGT